MPNVLPYTKSDARDWARAELQGVCNVIIPSFTRNMSDISEDGIRHDVRRELDHGFSGFLLVSEVAITVDEYLRFAAIAADESSGRLTVIHHASFNTLEENIDVTKRAGESGATVALLSYPASFYPTSMDEVEAYTRAFCDAVDMAVILFPVPLWGFERLHPASLPIDLLERLVDDVPNVVAIKAEGGYPGIGGFVEVWNRLNERVVVTMPLENDAIPFATLIPTQFIGTSNGEYYGPAVPAMFESARAGKHAEAMRLYWQIDPARRANAKIGGTAGWNTVHRMVWKYQAWLSGYNGGPLRTPTPRLVLDQMRTLRGGLIQSGLPVTDDPDELFFVGRHS